MIQAGWGCCDGGHECDNEPINDMVFCCCFVNQNIVLISAHVDLSRALRHVGSLNMLLFVKGIFSLVNSQTETWFQHLSDSHDCVYLC